MRRDIRELDRYLVELEKHPVTYYGLVILLAEIVLILAELARLGLDKLAAWAVR